MEHRILIATLALAVGTLACGDPATNDDRGYTKAPLENPGLLISGEPSSSMEGLGRTNRPRVVEREEPRGAAAEGEPGEERQVTLAPGVTQEQYDQGEQLFSGQGACQACHGPNGSGSTLAPDLSDEEWLHVPGPDVDALAELITAGVPQPVEYPAPMAPMGGASLSQEQVRALAAYVASLSQG